MLSSPGLCPYGPMNVCVMKMSRLAREVYSTASRSLLLLAAPTAVRDREAGRFPSCHFCCCDRISKYNSRERGLILAQNSTAQSITAGALVSHIQSPAHSREAGCTQALCSASFLHSSAVQGPKQGSGATHSGRCLPTSINVIKMCPHPQANLI